MIKVYTKNNCPYCHHAMALLDRLSLSYEEINLDGDFEAISKLVEQTQHRTMPQIFIENKFVGGYDDLKQLSDEGKLDDLRD